MSPTGENWVWHRKSSLLRRRGVLACGLTWALLPIHHYPMLPFFSTCAGCTDVCVSSFSTLLLNGWMTRQKSRSVQLSVLCALLQTQQFWQLPWICCQVLCTPRWFVPHLNTTFALVHLSTLRDVEGPFCWMAFTAPVRRYVCSCLTFTWCTLTLLASS